MFFIIIFDCYYYRLKERESAIKSERDTFEYNLSTLLHDGLREQSNIDENVSRYYNSFENIQELLRKHAALINKFEDKEQERAQMEAILEKSADNLEKWKDGLQQSEKEKFC